MAQKKKEPRYLSEPHPEKVPKTASNPEPGKIAWSFELVDVGGPWCIAKDVYHTELIVKKLRELSGMTWDDTKTGGKHHPQPVGDLTSDAQRRLAHIKLDDVDDLFRFEFGGTKRFWGIRRNNVFQVLWWDPNHQVLIPKNYSPTVYHVPRSADELEKRGNAEAEQKINTLQAEIRKLEEVLEKEIEEHAECRRCLANAPLPGAAEEGPKSAL